MNILPIISFLTSLILAIFIVSFCTKRLRILFVKKLINKALVNKAIYCSLVADELCSYILKSNKKKQQHIIKCLASVNISSVIKEIKDSNLITNIRIMEGKDVKENTNNITGKILKAKYYLKVDAQDKALKILRELSSKKMSLQQRAYTKYLSAQLSVFEGDMLSASEDLTSSIAFFKKENKYFEEAEAYFLLGTTHRISGGYDIADFMLKTASEIYSSIGASRHEAEVLGTLGLLMSAQNRFDEAQDYYLKAYKKAQGFKHLQEHIRVQQIMLEFLKNNKNQASKEASKLLEKTNNKIVKASLLDILSRISMSDKKYTAASRYAKNSFQIFFSSKNYPAAFESYYLYASALFESGKLKQSEQILRDLIKKEKRHSSCFHIATAYTLLGLILIKNKDFDRAKAIFNQAVSKEFCNNRRTGIAIDYANLAVVERLQGNKNEAMKNIEKALSQLSETDEILYNKIKLMMD